MRSSSEIRIVTICIYSRYRFLHCRISCTMHEMRQCAHSYRAMAAQKEGATSRAYGSSQKEEVKYFRKLLKKKRSHSRRRKTLLLNNPWRWYLERGTRYSRHCTRLEYAVLFLYELFLHNVQQDSTSKLCAALEKLLALKTENDRLQLECTQNASSIQALQVLNFSIFD